MMWIVWGDGLTMGDLVWRMREWPACVDLSKRMGKCARHGNGAGVWEAARPYGKPKSHQNQEYGNCDGLRTLHIFVNFGGIIYFGRHSHM